MTELSNNLSILIDKFSSFTTNITSFLSVQPELENQVKLTLKESYDLTKNTEDYLIKECSTLPSLIIDDFDSEQIWQQLEIQNKFIYDKLKQGSSDYTSKINESLSDNTDNECETDIEEENENILESKKKSVKFNLSDEESSGNEDKSKKPENLIKSTFEKRQERLQERVEKLEEEALTEKPWQMKGEVTAKKRPQNSLLEEVLEFDLNSRPPPVITEEVALKLEDVIIRRIKDKAWDDVERKIKPIDTTYEFKKKIVLNQEKSKLSLAQIYEQEYLKQKVAVNPENKSAEEEEPKEHKQLKSLLNSLFKKLDALSNYHYTPIPAIPELKIVNNLPAITMEEAIPSTISDANLLAPEEILVKTKGDLIGKEERNRTDKKRDRRSKKLKQRKKHNEIEKREKLLKKLKPGMGNKYSSEKIRKELAKSTSVSQFQEDSEKKNSKSSKLFFERLQDTISDNVKVKKKKEKPKIDAKRIKL